MLLSQRIKELELWVENCKALGNYPIYEFSLKTLYLNMTILNKLGDITIGGKN